MSLRSRPAPPPFIANPDSTEFYRRDVVVTQTVVQSQSASASATPHKSGGFPVAVAVPALVGGMAVALLAFGLYLWMAKRRRREKRRRWESAQRRARKRAASNATRPSMSSSRRPSVSNDRKPVVMPSEKEKEAIPPVPVLPKAHDPYAKTEKDYGYQPSMQQQAYDHHNPQDGQGYTQQPTIDQQEHDQYAQAQNAQPYQHNDQDAYAQDYPVQDQRGYQGAYETQPAQSPPTKTRKKGRTAARVAAAEEAAAAARSDPLKRHQTKKPSAFARQAQQADHPTGYYDNEEQQETLAPERQSYGAGASDDGRGRTSGQWGVSAGGGGSGQAYGHEQRGGSGGSGQGRYSNDPYLAGGQRAPSGQYTTDPYALYHDEREKSGEWSSVAPGGASKSNWI